MCRAAATSGIRRRARSTLAAGSRAPWGGFRLRESLRDVRASRRDGGTDSERPPIRRPRSLVAAAYVDNLQRSLGLRTKECSREGVNGQGGVRTAPRWGGNVKLRCLSLGSTSPPAGASGLAPPLFFRGRGAPSGPIAGGRPPAACRSEGACDDAPLCPVAYHAGPQGGGGGRCVGPLTEFSDERSP